MKNSQKLIPTAVAGLIVTSIATANAYAAEESSPNLSLDSSNVQAENVEQHQDNVRESTALEPSDRQPEISEDNVVTPPPVNQETNGNETLVSGKIESKNPEEISDGQKKEDEETIRQELDNAFTTSENTSSNTPPILEDTDILPSESTDLGMENWDLSPADEADNQFGSFTVTSNKTITSEDNEDITQELDNAFTPSEDTGSDIPAIEDATTPPAESADPDIEDWDLNLVGEAGSQFGNFTVISNETITSEDNENSSTQEIKLSMTLDRGDETAAALTQSDLEILVGRPLTPNADGTYSCTNNGVTYTYTVNSDGSTQHTECDVVVTITRTTQTGNIDEVNTKKDDEWNNQDIESSGEKTGSTPAAADVLNGVDRENSTFNGKKADIIYNEETGTISKIIVYDDAENLNGPSTTYIFDYSDITDTANLSLEDPDDQQMILSLLGGDFKLEDGKFYKTVDGTDHLMTDADIQIALKSQNVTMTVKIRSESETTPSDISGATLNGTQERVEKDATAKALINALIEAGGAGEGAECLYDKNHGYFVSFGGSTYPFTKNSDGTFSITVPGRDDDGTDTEKTYTFSIESVESDTEKGDLAEEIQTQLKNDKKELANGSTSTITTDVTVQGTVVTWTRTETGGSIISKEGTVVANKGEQFGAFTDETVQEITYEEDNDNLRIATVTTVSGDKKVTKTYTFTYGKATLDDLGLSEEELAKYEFDTDSLTKTSWTVEVKTAQNPTEITIKSEEKNTTSLTINTNGTLTYIDQDNHNVTLEYDKDKNAYIIHSDVNENGNPWTYTVSVEECDLDPDALESRLREELAKSDYKNITELKIDTNTNTAAFVCGGKSYTVEFEAPKQYQYTVTIEEPKTISSAESQDRLIEKINKVIAALSGQGKTLISVKHTNDSSSPDPSIKPEYWITPDTAINFNAMSEEELKTLLLELQAQSLKYLTDHNIENVAKHLDLGCDTGIAVDGVIIPCVILSTPSLWYSDDIEEILKKTGTVGNLQSIIRTDRVNLDADGNPIIHYEFENAGAKPEHYQFYYVKGQVGYNLLENTKEGGTSFRTYDEAQEALKKYLKDNPEFQLEDKDSLEKYIIPIYREVAYNNKKEPVNPDSLIQDGDNYIDGYRVYLNVADLEIYGFMDDRSNACGNKSKENGYGFDLKLGNLTLVEEGIAKGTGAGIQNWTADCIIRSFDSFKACILQLTNIITGGEGGSELTGNYMVSEKLYDREDGTIPLNAAGSASGSYSEYSLWETLDGIKSAANRTWYEGSAAYILQHTDYVIDEQERLVRNLNAAYTVSQDTPPLVPPPINPPAEEDPDEVDIQDPDVPLVQRPNEVTVPDGDGGVPVTSRPNRNVLLVDIPSENVPLAGTPDGNVLLVDIPDGAVPLVNIPDGAVPLVNIPDEAVPLANVPRTGENIMLELAAALTAGASALWLGLAKKRRR